MKIFALLLMIVPISVSASAPFGVNWGDDIAAYGEVIKRLDFSEVNTDRLPKNFSIAKHYQLVQVSEKGLVKVVMTTHDYSAHSASFKDDFQQIEASLIASGYQTTAFTSGELNSYQCVLQGRCAGKRWTAMNTDGVTVILEQKMKGRDSAFINLEFETKEFINIEKQRLERQQEKQKQLKNKDRLAFSS
ncbi:conserved hypothetical protein [Shewanella halifaxensis HAW-EB4]|uniref:Orphan protein n=1 Tax=Shewanella halifaxensis (strain HAW-EB4) TaxID=458817 RepID=B0TRU3_SHEHH|nr:hypothetical protein [Shewanella halifaxensis]ABZ77855.1 conserved hypothetical protein [Shewanella halifaxensis HAW-EB4]